MPRFGLFCSEFVLRVPNETSLLIDCSILRASISRTICAIRWLRTRTADPVDGLELFRCEKVIWDAGINAPVSTTTGSTNLAVFRKAIRIHTISFDMQGIF
jgi:hypothetical protein